MGWISNGTGGAVYTGETEQDRRDRFERLRRQYELSKLAGLPQAKPTRRSTAARGSPGVLAGYPIVFNQETVIGGLFREIIAEGAADEVLDQDVRALFNHDKNLVLGRTTSGTLGLEADRHGVWMRLVLPDTATAREVQELVGRGDLSQGSFAFVPKEETWYPSDRSGMPLVVVERLQYLLDVSVVTYPAYAGTRVEQGLADPPDPERQLQGRMRLHGLRRLHGRGMPIPPRELRGRLEGHRVRTHAFPLGLEAAINRRG